MPTEIIMPKLGLTMTTGTIVSWLMDEGADVGEKEPVLEIETEKLSYNIESPAGGVLLKKLAAVGEKYPIAAVLGYVGSPGETIPGTDAPPLPGAPQPQTISAAPSHESDLDSALQVSHSTLHAPHSTLPVSHSALDTPHPALAPDRRVFISPLAKKIAASMGLDYTQIKGAGPNGRIVKADVIGFAEAGASGAASAATAAPAAAYTAAISATAASATAASAAMPKSPGTILPYAGLRRAVGETMKKAWLSIPMVTHQVSANAGALLECRASINAGVDDKAQCVTVGELLIKLTAAALAAMPVVNSSLTDEGIVLHKHVNIGMATALDEGLLVPVIRNADRKSLLALSREAKDLAARARSGALLPDDMSGATFTVSNLGGFGSVDFFTPIINPPQAAILGVGRIVDTAVPVAGEIKIYPMIGLSLTYDHRIIDGATAAGFIKTVMELMRNPIRALL